MIPPTRILPSQPDLPWTSEISAIRLSHDHKATDASEIARIELAGGFVLKKRVLGMLAVSRAFGDHGLKQYVCANPYSSAYQIEEGRAPLVGKGKDGGAVEEKRDPPSLLRDRFLVIACDGVWDVMTDEEAVEIVAAHFRETAVKERALATISGVESHQAQEGEESRRVPETISPEMVRGAAAVLTEAAVLRGSSDNVTALVVVL